MADERFTSAPEHGSLAPWVFWAIVILAFACVLAKAGGWL